MMIEQLEKMFEKESLDFEFLKNEFTEVKEYFEIGKIGGFNAYDNGVKSFTLEGTGDEKPSTFGYLPKGGEFEFNVGANHETMRFLEGKLSWGLNGEQTVSPKKYDRLSIPAQKTFTMKVEEASFYICDYKPE